MNKVSIIVPIYNTEEYLEKCLDSILKQTYKNYEVIIINDGSTDNSQKIINKYTDKYPEYIKAYENENRGVSRTRNFGIEKATGDYITFVDSDDYIDINMLDEMIKKLNDADYDLIISDLLYVYPNKNVIGSSNIQQDLIGSKDIKDKMNKILPAMCGKLIKKEIFDKIKFKENIWYEDVEIYFRMYTKVSKIGFINKPLYYYIQRENSITYTYSDKLFDIINIWDDIIDYYKQNNYYEEYKEELEYAIIRYSFATFTKRLAKCKDLKKFTEGIKYAIKKCKERFPNYKNNKYLKEFNPKNIYLKYFNINIAKIIFLIEKNKLN